VLQIAGTVTRITGKGFRQLTARHHGYVKQDAEPRHMLQPRTHTANKLID
jgi:hypothetical protein